MRWKFMLLFIVLKYRRQYRKLVYFRWVDIGYCQTCPLPYAASFPLYFSLPVLLFEVSKVNLWPEYSKCRFFFFIRLLTFLPREEIFTHWWITHVLCKPMVPNRGRGWNMLMGAPRFWENVKKISIFTEKELYRLGK